MTEKSVVVLLSGGLDSATLLYALKSEGYDVHALSILYGQRHKKEITAAKEIAASIGARHTISDITGIASIFSGSALTSSEIPVPHGHYTDDSMKQTVVPNRNMVFLSLAGSLACSLKAYGVAFAAHAGDHTIYPDCRPAFAAAMQQAFASCDWNPPLLITPFIEKDKAAIVSIGVKLKVPYELTWSCYEGGEIHCGECGTCNERKEAFTNAGVTDPTRYKA